MKCLVILVKLKQNNKDNKNTIFKVINYIDYYIFNIAIITINLKTHNVNNL